MKEKKHLSFDTENLAVPEIHVHSAGQEEPEDMRDGQKDNMHLNIKYDNLALPEIVTGKDPGVPPDPSE